VAATTAASRKTQRTLAYKWPTNLGLSPTHCVDVEGLVRAKLGLIRPYLSLVMKTGSSIRRRGDPDALPQHSGEGSSRRGFRSEPVCLRHLLPQDDPLT
jgi:hypothetical protein